MADEPSPQHTQDLPISLAPTPVANTALTFDEFLNNVTNVARSDLIPPRPVESAYPLNTEAYVAQRKLDDAVQQLGEFCGRYFDPTLLPRVDGGSDRTHVFWHAAYVLDTYLRFEDILQMVYIKYPAPMVVLLLRLALTPFRQVDVVSRHTVDQTINYVLLCLQEAWQMVIKSHKWDHFHLATVNTQIEMLRTLHKAVIDTLSMANSPTSGTLHWKSNRGIMKALLERMKRKLNAMMTRLKKDEAVVVTRMGLALILAFGLLMITQEWESIDAPGWSW